MIKPIIVALLTLNWAFAVTTTAKIVEAVEFPVTITYSSGAESIDLESTLQKTMDKGNVETVNAEISGSGSAQLSKADEQRLKTEYCSNTYSASEFEEGIRPLKSEVAKLKVLKANNTMGKTSVIRMSLDYYIPYMNSKITTFIICK